MDIISSMDFGDTKGCGCSMCQNGDGYSVDPVLNGDTYYDGGSSAPTTYGTTNQMVTQLVSGYWASNGQTSRQWAQDTVTFSISNDYTVAEKDSFRMAFTLWADVADINFQEVASGGSINIVEGNDGGAWSGSSVYVGSNDIASNTISIDTDAWSSLTGIGGYGIQTILHEIGHSLGLGHQGNYNGNVNYDTQVLYLNDNRQYSLMSYNNANLLGTDHWAQSGVWQYAATPLLYDIMAIQQIYGVNTSTRSGDTTYGFNSNAGHAQYDLSVNSAPFAIWDGGGTDTLDLSGYVTNQTITLVEGAFTSAGYMTNNIVIAFGAVIENAIGGSGNDSVTGNAANNILHGGLGNDMLYGSTGSDTLDGDGGTDTVSYSYSIGAFLVTLIDSVTVTLQHLADMWTDTVTDVENFIFNGTALTFAEVSALSVDLDPIRVRQFWSGGGWSQDFEDTGLTTVTAANMNYVSATGDLVTVNRTSSGITVTFLQDTAPNEMDLNAGTNNDAILITGTNNGLAAIIYGGDGDDTITIQTSGNDKLYGQNGDDTIYGGAGNDTILGDLVKGSEVFTGNDILYGQAGDDTLFGHTGNDALYGGIDNDKLYGGTGRDLLDGGTGNDFLNGEDGDDDIIGGDDNDGLVGGAGLDTLDGGNGDDEMYGDGDADTMNGGTGIDLMYGGVGNDIMHGDNDADRLYGGTDDDQMYGDAGNDKLYGEAGNDTIYGGDGDDIIHGMGNIDTLYGGAGADELYGGDGVDLLVGGAGADKLYAGNAQDVFGFTEIDGFIDSLEDFAYSGTSRDKINITDILSGFTAGVDDIDSFVRLVYKNSNRTDLQINADGAGSDFQTIAMIRGSDLIGVTAQNMYDLGKFVTNDTLL